MITCQLYLVPDPSGLGQIGDSADVSPSEANPQPTHLRVYELERVLRTLGGSEGARTRGLLRDRQAL